MPTIATITRLCSVICCCLLCAQVDAAVSFSMNKVMKIRVGKTVERSYDDLANDSFAYGPKQTYDPASRETLIYLPYGTNEQCYYEPPAGVLTDCPQDGFALFHSKGDGKNISHLTYALAFDKYIGSIRLNIGYAEVVMAPPCVAGVEYSVDGKTWAAIHEHPRGHKGTVNSFVPNVTIDGLKTKKLLLRIYTRNADQPDAVRSENQYLKIRMTGNPTWGDAKTTFFKCQNQLAVTEYGK